MSRVIFGDWRLIATPQTEIRSQAELGDREQFLVGSQAGSVTLVCCRVREWVEQVLLTEPTRVRHDCQYAAYSMCMEACCTSFNVAHAAAVATPNYYMACELL